MKYNEDKKLKEVEQYIKGTYQAHYAKGKIETYEVIKDKGYGEAFCLSNIIKYAMRYGEKGGKNPKDLYKIIHYALMALDEE